MAELTSLKKQRSTIKAKMTNIIKFIHTIDDDTDVEAIRTRVSRVDSLINEFTTVEGKIFDVSHEEEPDFEFEEKYYVAKTKLNSLLRQRTIVPGNVLQGADTTLNTSHNAQAEVKLPKISIPHFSGEYTEWQSFFDLFSTTIHDSTILSPVQKFQYLKGSLKGEAAALLRHISVTEANYLEALNKLRNRYDRKKHIINSFIRTFVEHPPLHTANAAKMKNLLDSADEVVRGLKALGPTAESRDPWLIYWLVTKLDDKSKCMWAETSAEMENPNLDNFFKFLQIRIDALESLSSSLKPGHSKNVVKGHVAESEPVTYACAFCQQKNHSLFDCSQFNNLAVNQRREWVKKDRRCFNCLSRRHAIFNCQSRRRCRTCSGKHHTLLHANVTETEEDVQSGPSTSTSNKQITNLNATVMYSNSAKVLRLQSILPTASITVLDVYGEPQRCRALLDSGSQASFIAESCVQQLNLKRNNSRIAVSGLGLSKAGFTRGRVTIVVQPPNRKGFEINALVLPKLTSHLPSQVITSVSAEMWGTMKLADPDFNQPGEVDIIIGADHFFSMLLDGRKQPNQDGPIMQNTIFGWVLSGTCKEDRESTTSFLATNYFEPEADLDATLKRFWEIESIGEERNILSAEEKLCEQHFKENVRRNADGRFVVALPFKQPSIKLSNTLNIAIQRLRSMERRFERDPEFKLLYHAFMTEYEQLHHMEQIRESEITNEGYYLPHHGVLKKTTSSTTKLRVVFDGSATCNTGQSINSNLAVGPTIQSNLFAIVLRFREHKIAISADIEKMYRQVLVNRKDTKFQQIVWRKRPSDPISYYRLLTVTYGLSSAPFLAIRCLKQIAEEHKHSNPIACHEIEKNVYVDDLMTAVDTEQEGIQLRNEISNLLSQYGFQLRKWSSNCPEVLNSVPNKEGIGNIKELDDATIESSPQVKVLGVSWDPQADKFTFKASLQSHTQVTKRIVLSEASRLFDPLGWLTPVVVQVKIFMQKLWILSLKWDDPLPEEQKQQWKTIRCNLQEVEQITIPRYINSSYYSTIDIHGFCDASENAYAAAIYFKITTPQDVFVQLVTAKSKVAPIKQVSLPRLELCGAVLLTNLIATVKRETSLKIHNIFAWTDSKIVLDWLANEPRRWTTFVANRTSLIMDVIPRSHWRHVPSSENPADCASRGLLASKLRKHSLWWNGPEWLHNHEEHWPRQESYYGCNQEVRATKVEAFGGFLANELLDTMLAKYSSFFKLQRVIAFILRFINNSRANRNKQRTKGHFIKPHELHFAFKILCAYEQAKSYHQEISDLKRGSNIHKSSCLKSLNPFLDRDNLLRVGGRIENSTASYSTKHPVILSPKSILTRLILEDLHKSHNHAGPSLLLAIFRQMYWSTGGRTIVREVTKRCVICRQYKATLQQQMMGELPTSRVELVRPFYTTGVDFAGPLLIHLKKGRGQRTYKAYICVFVCLSTKAVHLELVGDLTSESFIAALKRFVARRGVPAEVHSDNGTNFVGANNIIREEFEKVMKSTNFSQFLSRNSISWHFIPPHAPHFGGIWEAAVKSAKFHLTRVIGKTILTIEEMSTLLTEVESCLNSRPICVLSADEIDPLTPGHFLVGHPLTKIPELDITELKPSYLTRWKMIKQLSQHFWQRWQSEYLTSLQQRTKWTHPKPSIQINDVVIIKENTYQNQWLLGKVIQLHPGADGKVRVVTLQTKSGELKRPIHKLCLLPVHNNTDEINTTKLHHTASEMK